MSSKDRTTKGTKYPILFGSLLLVAILLTATSFSALAASDPDSVSFTLEGCRNDGSITLPNGSGQFICPDAAYTSGNLGKGWNELDLVPYRLTAKAGNSAPNTQTYTLAVVVDQFDAGHPGYDVLSVPQLNTALSDSSCTALTAGPSSSLTPGLGGIDSSLYRLVTITQAKNTTCVYDYYARLALGSHLFPGSSLHANLANQSFGTAGIGAKDVSIPVKEILPQELSKDMSATQGSDVAWEISKDATPAKVSFPNTCDVNAATSAPVEIKVVWTKLAAQPGGPVTVITHVYAKNPASRVIQVNVTDKIYSGSTQTTLLDTATSGAVDVPANTTQLVLTHTFVWNSPNTTTLNDVATATYTDLVTGVPVPGTTEAKATATVQNTGPVSNDSATIQDIESILAGDFSYSADSFTGASGSFDSYTAGTVTKSTVTWNSDTQSDSGQVTFAKTVYVDQATNGSSTLSDTATLTGSSGFSASKSASIAIQGNAYVSLNLTKTIPNVLTGSETATFKFHVVDANNNEAATPEITFAAGETSKTITIDNLLPSTYTVSEDAVTGWNAQSYQTVAINLPTCSNSVTFNNTIQSAKAQVKKVSVPAGFEAGWTFDLKNGNGSVIESVTSSGSGNVNFSTNLGEGSYSIVETTQDGWSSDGGVGCTFTVDLPADSGKTYSCVFTNTYQPSVKLTKTGADLSKIGDEVKYVLTLQNTSSAGGAAGVPDLACTITDSKLSFTKNVTLAAGDTDTSNLTFKIPSGASDPFVNTAVANCKYPGLSTVVANSQANWSTNLFQPGVKLTKSGPAYSKEGDTITYVINIVNQSSSDAPDLILDSFSDSLVAGVTLPAECSPLASGASCTTSYSIPVTAGMSDPLVNTATVHYHPAAFPNDIYSSAKWTVDLLHPSFTVTKVCKAEPVAQAGPAVFKITFKNTGDADLHVEPSEGSPFDVAAGQTTSYEYSVNGPFSATVDNTVTGTVTLASKYGLANSYTFSASDSCDVAGAAQVVKTVSGAALTDPNLDFTFQLRTGASTTEVGTIIETQHANASNGGNISFSTQLVPGQTYQLCEIVMPGWLTSLGSFVPNSFIPPDGVAANPNVDNSILCADFTVASGETVVFTVDNTPPPGGRALTIGFWKNWASCKTSNGGQDPVLDQTLFMAEPVGIVVSAQSGVYPGFAPTIYLVLHGDPNNPDAATDCLKAVRLLNKSTINNGTKKASDAAFNLAAQLVAAELNYAAGAGKTTAATSAINEAVVLLGKYKFDGITHTKISAADTTRMNQLAKILDDYNNNR